MKKTILYDGDCPMCQALVKNIEGSKQHHKFQARDAKHSDLPTGVTPESVDKFIHLIDDRREIHRGMEAVWLIAEEYPGGRALAWLGRLPLLKQLADLTYRLVATNRYRLFGSPVRILIVKLIAAVAGLVVIAILAFLVWWIVELLTS